MQRRLGVRCIPARLRPGLEGEVSRNRHGDRAGGECDRCGPSLHALREVSRETTRREGHVARRQRLHGGDRRTKNRQIHIGFYGPGSYARAYAVSGGNTVAFTTTQNQDGSIGYYSVVYVKADSPYKSLDDLKGKKLGLVDVESTSGYKAPTFFMSREGKPPEKFFSVAQVTGSHENAVLALNQGTVDAAANWWNSDTDSNLTRMINKGMLKKSDGTPLKYEDFRIVWKSPLLAGSPFAYLNHMPDDLARRPSPRPSTMSSKNEPEIVQEAVRRQGPRLRSRDPQGLPRVHRAQ